MTNTGKIIIWGIVVVVAIALIMIYGGVFSQNQNSGAGSTSESSSSNTTNNSGSNSLASNPSAPISFITPVAGDDWVIASTSVISWTKSASSTGAIELLNASTMKLAGVILPQIGPSQTSYTWNTRDIFASRTSANKTTVQPGNYIIEVMFDSNDVPNITSSPFTISQ